MLATSGSLHRTLHHDKPLGANLCAACLLAQGQVAAADISAAVVSTTLSLDTLVVLKGAEIFSRFAFLLPLGRAPPPF